MSVMLPHRRSFSLLLGLLLVDLPVLTLALVAGVRFGFRDSFWAISDWRFAHPWSFVPTVALAAVLVRRWWRARPTEGGKR